MKLTTSPLIISVILIGGIIAFPLFVSAGPERNPADIQRAGQEQLRALLAQRLDIASVNQERIRAWLSMDEFEWVKTQGWSVQWVPLSAEDYWPPEDKGIKSITYPVTSYPTYATLVTELENFATTYPNLCSLENIGQSYEGRDLLFLKITDNPTLEEDEPEFKYIAAMHGNETLGVALTLNLIDLLLSEYGNDSRITGLVDETEIWIMPLMNPDGYVRNPRTRDDAQGNDLNRTFPDRVDDPNNTTEGRPPETAAVMTFSSHHSFVMSANFHTGDLVVNYPYDNSFNNNIEKDPDWYTPDNDVFLENALAYSRNNPSLYASTQFENGVTNGIEWYPISGGMQDWNYVWPGCFEVTIELSNTYSPSTSQLPTYWNNNRESMLAYIERVHSGVRGLVTDSVSGLPLAAAVTVEGRSNQVFTDPDVGDYHRLLLPGTYSLIFSAAGYTPQTRTGIVVTDGAATRLDVALTKTEEETGLSSWRLY